MTPTKQERASAQDTRVSPVSRLRAGGTHRNTLVTSWRVRVSAIEFIKDYPMRENGNNLSDKGRDAITYPLIRENFKGWGLGPYLKGWDWEGQDNPARPACYRRQEPVHMRVRLRSTVAPPAARSFVLHADPKIRNGQPAGLARGSVNVDWPAGAKELIVEIVTGGQLPNEVSRYDLLLTWSIQAASSPAGQPSGIVQGTLAQTRHTIYSIFEDPLEPSVSNSSGNKWFADTGLTRQRLDKLILAIGGRDGRFPVSSPADVDHLIWKVHVHVNDSSPPYFNGERGAIVQYGKNGPKVAMIDQWVMWLASHTWARPPKQQPHWNYGACISYAQLMKTMLAIAGINSQRAWVYPKTTLLPDGTFVRCTDSDIVDLADGRAAAVTPQEWTFRDRNGLEYKAQVRLIDKPNGKDDIRAEAFEACLYYGGKLVPGAIPTRRYPAKVLQDRVGFASAKDLLRWWHDVKHGDFERFMVWVSDSPPAYFDKNGHAYANPYHIPRDKRLPVP